MAIYRNPTTFLGNKPDGSPPTRRVRSSDDTTTSEERGMLYRGQPVDDMTRDELLTLVYELALQIQRERTAHSEFIDYMAQWDRKR